MNPQDIHLIPVSEDKRAEVDEYFHTTMFGNVNTFIAMFNSGILNRSFDETRDMADLVRDSFGNVSITRNTLVVQSPVEYQAHRLAEIFEGWKVIASVRRELNEFVNDVNHPIEPETVLYIQNNGTVSRIDGEKMYNTRLSRLNKEAKKELLRISTARINDESQEQETDEEFNLAVDNMYGEDYDAVTATEDSVEETEDTSGSELPDNVNSRIVHVSDILNLDDGFISRAYDSVVQ